MTIHELHAKRRGILNDIKGAEMSGDYALAAHLLSRFQEVNHLVRDIEEGYHPMDAKHDLAMMETAPWPEPLPPPFDEAERERREITFMENTGFNPHWRGNEVGQ